MFGSVSSSAVTADRQIATCQTVSSVTTVVLQTNAYPVLPFRFQLLDGLPVSDQLVKAVKRAVLTGELAAGELLPSVRAIAQALKISPTTAHKAVLELRDAGFLATRPGAGMVVVKPAGATRDQLIDQLSPVCLDLIRQARQLGLTPEEIQEALRRHLP